MDIATIIGIVSGTILIIFAIVLGGDFMIFINLPSALVVIGGMIAAVFVMSPLEHIINAFKVAINAFTTKPLTAPEIIVTITDLTLKARKNGTLSLENEVIENKFLSKGIRYIVDGVDPTIIELLMGIDIANMKLRHKTGSTLFKSFAAYGPAFGMIGTLIGLVQMLQTLDDPSSIGPAMAVALLTTFYGAVMANLIFTPISAKLSIRSDEESLVMKIIMDGVLSLVAGDNPKIVQEKLETYLPPKLRKMEQEMLDKQQK
ncbi:motility protein A [Thermodesulfobacteriota bacterium]